MLAPPWAGFYEHCLTDQHKDQRRLVDTRYLACVIAAAVLSLSAGAAQATKLDNITCDALKLERSRIETEAIKSDMAKGPEWAKGNLSKDRLGEIELLIGLQENIAFRCPLPRPTPSAPGAAAAVQAPNSEPDEEPSSSNANPDGKKPDARKTSKSKNGGQGAGGPNGTTPGSSKVKPLDTAKKASQNSEKQIQSPPPKSKNSTVIMVTPGGKSVEAPPPPAVKKPKVSDAYVPPPRLGEIPGDAPQAAPAPVEAENSAATVVPKAPSLSP